MLSVSLSAEAVLLCTATLPKVVLLLSLPLLVIRYRTAWASALDTTLVFCVPTHVSNVHL